MRETARARRAPWATPAGAAVPGEAPAARRARRAALAVALAFAAGCKPHAARVLVPERIVVGEGLELEIRPPFDAVGTRTMVCLALARGARAQGAHVVDGTARPVRATAVVQADSGETLWWKYDRVVTRRDGSILLCLEEPASAQGARLVRMHLSASPPVTAERIELHSYTPN
jgi:hypothetical protein